MSAQAAETVEEATDDEDSSAVAAPSQARGRHQAAPSTANTAALPPTPAPTALPISAASGVLGDRAAMEKERLERQAARLASTTKGYSVVKMPAPPTPRPSRSGGITTLGDLANRSGNGHASSSSQSIRQSAHPVQSPGPFPSDAAGEYYLDGETRHSALTIGNDATEPTFGPADVIGRVSDHVHGKLTA